MGEEPRQLSPEELRQQISVTRDDLSRDVDAIAQKASPSRIAHDRVDQVKAVTGRQIERVRAEPRRPALVAGSALLAVTSALFLRAARRNKPTLLYR